MKIGNGEFFHGDCLEVMASIPDGSVDFICTDLPWGRLDNTAWDIPVDLNRLFEHFWRIAKPAQHNSYEFKPKNNPTWTCYAVRRSETSPVFCTPDAPGYSK